MGKDRKGLQRGACSHPSCECDDYELPSEGHPCAYCGHYPAEHKAAGSPRQPSQPVAEVKVARPAPSTSSSSNDPFFSFAASSKTSSPSSAPTSAPPSSGSSFSSYTATTTSFSRPTAAQIPESSTSSSTSSSAPAQHQQRQPSPPSSSASSYSASRAKYPEHYTTEVQTAFSSSSKRTKPKESLPLQLWNNPQEVVRDVKIKVKQKTKKHQA